jgi:hypothetical protein
MRLQWHLLWLRLLPYLALILKTKGTKKPFYFGQKLALDTLKGQSHEKVGEMSVWGISLGPN